MPAECNLQAGKARASLYFNDLPVPSMRRLTSASGRPGAEAPADRGTMITVALGGKNGYRGFSFAIAFIGQDRAGEGNSRDGSAQEKTGHDDHGGLLHSDGLERLDLLPFQRDGSREEGLTGSIQQGIRT